MSSDAQTARRILLLENIHPVAREALLREGHEVTLLAHSPDRAELSQLLQRHDVVGLRSKTRLTKDLLLQAPHLALIGCFCIGTDQVDLATANSLGIPVFNAPYSNTRSVAEMVLAEVIMLARQLGDRNMAAHRGQWLKSADGSREVRGKTLGIVGYGHIGSQVSVLAEAFGLRVLFYDVIKKLPLGNSQSVDSLAELLRRSDFVSLHVPDTRATRGLMGAAELQLMRPGSALINASRGTVVDIPALAEAIRRGHLSGAAVDVFPEEPASNSEGFKSELQGLPNVILTPHIGGSTLEAQESIGLEVAASFIAYLRDGHTLGAVNFPPLALPRQHPDATRIANVHRNVPGVLGSINSIVSELGANIQGQALATDEQIGFVVMDVEVQDAGELLKRVSALSTSIRTSLLP